MRRLTLLLALVAVAGCGGGGDEPSDSASRTEPAQTTTTPGTVENTDGLIGDATVSRPGEEPEVSQGGKPDPKPRPRPGGAAGVAGSGACEGSDLQPTAENVAPVAAATLCLVNNERSAAGLPALRTNDLLAQAAQVHGASMVNESYFSHTGSDGSEPSDRAARTGYTKGEWVVGENLAWGTGSLAEPRSIIVSWMNSQGHRENILRSQFEEIGVAVVPGNPKAKDGAGGTFVTVFGRVSGGGGSTAGSASGSGSQSQSSSGRSASSASRARRRCQRLKGKRRTRCVRAARARRR